MGVPCEHYKPMGQTNKPIGAPLESHGGYIGRDYNAMGVPWVTHGSIMIPRKPRVRRMGAANPWEPHGSPTGYQPWKTHGRPMGGPRQTYGRLVGELWEYTSASRTRRFLGRLPFEPSYGMTTSAVVVLGCSARCSRVLDGRLAPPE